jgi:hypothetical protein
LNSLTNPRVRQKVAALMVWGHDGKQRYTKQQIERRVEKLLERLAHGEEAEVSQGSKADAAD